MPPAEIVMKCDCETDVLLFDRARDHRGCVEQRSCPVRSRDCHVSRADGVAPTAVFEALVEDIFDPDART